MLIINILQFNKRNTRNLEKLILTIIISIQYLFNYKKSPQNESSFKKQGEKNYCLYSAIISLTPSGETLP